MATMVTVRGNTPMATVEGIYTETGSIYIWDIDAVIRDGKAYKLAFTPAQLKAKKTVQTFFG